jgi:hypothetical protein
MYGCSETHLSAGDCAAEDDDEDAVESRGGGGGTGPDVELEEYLVVATAGVGGPSE